MVLRVAGRSLRSRFGRGRVEAERRSRL